MKYLVCLDTPYEDIDEFYNFDDVVEFVKANAFIVTKVLAVTSDGVDIPVDVDAIKNLP